MRRAREEWNTAALRGEARIMRQGIMAEYHSLTAHPFTPTLAVGIIKDGHQMS